MGVDLAEEGSVRRGRPAGSVEPDPTPSPGSQAFRLDGLLLLDSAGNDPVTIEAIIFADEGIGVIRSPGGPPRVLPWSSVSAHVVERWAGGMIPEWWVDPQRNGADSSGEPTASVIDPDTTTRSLPHAEAGAVIAIRTPFGTYRFLQPGADANQLSNRITDFAVRHQGLAGVPSVTTVARPRQGNDRRQGSRSTQKPAPPTSHWSKLQPYLVVALIVVIGTAITLILLQSAGAIHLPFLGGTSPGSVVAVRIR
jgi:hypothetical protein